MELIVLKRPAGIPIHDLQEVIFGTGRLRAGARQRAATIGRVILLVLPCLSNAPRNLVWI